MTMGDWFQHGIRIDSVPVDDRAFQYGDGVFETIAVRDASPRFWESHVVRLALACDKVGLAMPAPNILLRDLENCVINGVAPAADPQGGSSIRRSMNGIIHSITTNQFQPGVGPIPSGAGGEGDELTEEVLNAAMREIWEQSSGAVDTIVVGGAQKRRINSFISSSRAYAPDDTS